MQTKTGGSRECSFPFTELEAALFFLKNYQKRDNMPSMLFWVILISSLLKLFLKSVLADMLVKSKLQNSKYSMILSA